MLIVWILLGIAMAIGVFLLAVSLTYRNRREPHRRTPAVFGITFDEVRFPTRNGKTLYGWWIPAREPDAKRPVVILVHGWGRNVERMLPYIEKLHGQGYHLLAFDSRGHGSSDPDGYSTMLKFAEDTMAAVDYVAGRPEADLDRIGVVGLSIGGAGSIYAAAHDPRIRAVVTVGAFAHPASIMRSQFRKARVPYFPLVWLFFRYLEFRIGARLDDIAPVNNIGNTEAKVFLVHGTEDEVVPVAHGEQLFSRARPESAEFWRVPGKGHSDCHTHPEFWERLSAFFGRVFV